MKIFKWLPVRSLVNQLSLVSDLALGLARSAKVAIALAVDFCSALIVWALTVSPTLYANSRLFDEVSALAVFVAVFFLVSWRFGLYRAFIRFAGVKVLIAVGSGYVAATVALALVQYFSTGGAGFAQYVGLVSIGVCLSAGSRIFLRELMFRVTQTEKSPAIIYGAGESGRQLLTSVIQSREFSVVAFVDDARSIQGAEFHGVRVYSPSDLPVLCAKYGVESVLLALPSISRGRRAAILDLLEKYNVKVKTVPKLSDVLAGRKNAVDLQDIPVEELLGRDPVTPVQGLMRGAIEGKVVCVTGAGGSIGGELVKQLIKLNPSKLVLVEISEFALYEVLSSIEADASAAGISIIPVLQSVTDCSRLTTLLEQHNVALIFHAAAYKHVPLVEANPFAGVLNNVFGTQATLDAARAAGVDAVVLVSTDKAVRPTNVMGATKRIAELIAQAYSQVDPRTVMSMVRFGNVLASSGSVIPRFKAQILEGGPVTVTHPEITRYFMTIPEAVELVIQTAGMSKGGDVFLLDMGEPVKILDLAKRVIRLSGFKPVIEDSQDRSAAHAHSSRGSSASIPIVFSGLRPGEKLYEELLIDAAAAPTEHPMIFRASEGFLPLNRLQGLLADLRQACEAENLDALRRSLVAFEIGYTRPESDEPVPGSDWQRASVPTPVPDQRASSLASSAEPSGNRVAKGEGNTDQIRPINPLLSKALHWFFLVTRPLTLGARAIVLSPSRQVLLVRHRYEEGWQLPGGGVETGESAVEALRREVEEETGVRVLGSPFLVGSFHNREVSGRDHVLVYRCEEYKVVDRVDSTSEIAESGFFPLEALPAGTTPATRRRLAECLEGRALEECW